MERNGNVAASHRKMRLVYFGIAASWGFLCGVVGLAAALATRGHAIWVEDPLFLLLLLPPFAVAIGGAALASAAYREARRRTR